MGNQMTRQIQALDSQAQHLREQRLELTAAYQSARSKVLSRLQQPRTIAIAFGLGFVAKPAISYNTKVSVNAAKKISVWQRALSLCYRIFTIVFDTPRAGINPGVPDTLKSNGLKNNGDRTPTI